MLAWGTEHVLLQGHMELGSPRNHHRPQVHGEGGHLVLRHRAVGAVHSGAARARPQQARQVRATLLCHQAVVNHKAHLTKLQAHRLCGLGMLMLGVSLVTEAACTCRVPEECPKEIDQLIARCTDPNPGARPTAKQVRPLCHEQCCACCYCWLCMPSLMGASHSVMPSACSRPAGVAQIIQSILSSPAQPPAPGAAAAAGAEAASAPAATHAASA